MFVFKNSFKKIKQTFRRLNRLVIEVFLVIEDNAALVCYNIFLKLAFYIDFKIGFLNVNGKFGKCHFKNNDRPLSF